MEHLDNRETRAEIGAALASTIKHGFGLNHSLCHGDLGNIEPLLLARQLLDEAQWCKHVEDLSADILYSIKTDGFICGTPSGVETPGLMTGLAGIGYGLLRLAEPHRVPSVLLLAPPVIR